MNNYDGNSVAKYFRRNSVAKHIFCDGIIFRRKNPSLFRYFFVVFFHRFLTRFCKLFLWHTLSIFIHNPWALLYCFGLWFVAFDLHKNRLYFVPKQSIVLSLCKNVSLVHTSLCDFVPISLCFILVDYVLNIVSTCSSKVNELKRQVEDFNYIVLRVLFRVFDG